MVLEAKSSLVQKVNDALSDIRPFLAIDGGNVEVIDITDDMIVHVKWLGNCSNCNMSQMTMKAGVERAIKQQLPEIKSVVAIN